MAWRYHGNTNIRGQVAPIKLTVTKSNGTTQIVHSFQLSAEIDKNKELQKRRLDGITCFITNDLTIPTMSFKIHVFSNAVKGGVIFPLVSRVERYVSGFHCPCSHAH